MVHRLMVRYTVSIRHFLTLYSYGENKLRLFSRRKSYTNIPFRDLWCVSLFGRPRFMDSPRLVCPLLDSCAPMYCGPGATRPRTCRSLRREAEGGAAQARGAGGFTRTVARFDWVQRSVRLLVVFACSFSGVCVLGGCTPLAWAEKNVTGQIPYCLLRGRCARLSCNATGDGRREQACPEGEPHGGSPHGPRERHQRAVVVAITWSPMCTPS